MLTNTPLLFAFWLLATFAYSPVATVGSVAYEGQHESMSWIKGFMGDIKHAALVPNINISVTASVYGLAAINLVDGSLLWRREVKVATMHVFDSSSRAVSVSESELHLWCLHTGQLVFNTGSGPLDTVKATCQSQNVLVFVQSGHASLLDVKSGYIRWSVALGDLKGHVYCVVSDKTVAVAMLSGDGDHAVSFTHLDISSGYAGITTTQNNHVPLSAHGTVINNTLVVFSDDLQQLCTVHAGTQAASCESLPFTPSGSPEIRVADSVALLSIPASTGTRRYIAGMHPKPMLLPLPTSITAVSSPFRLDTRTACLAIEHMETTKDSQVVLIDAFSGVEIQREAFPGYPGVHVDRVVAQPAQVWMSSSAHANSSIPFLLKADDMSLSYNSGVEWLWIREEALAEIEEVEILDVNRTLYDVGEVPLPAPRQRPLSVCQGDVHEVMWQRGCRSGMIQGVLWSLQDYLLKYFDAMNTIRGRQKVILAASLNHKLYALNASTGRRIWSRSLPYGMSLVTMEAYPCFRGVMDDIQALLVVSNSTDAVAMLLNPGTGLIEHQTEISGEVTHVHSLDRGKCDSFGFLMAGISEPFLPSVPVHVFPETATVITMPDTRFWALHKQSGNVVGYMLEVESKMTASMTTRILAKRSWTFSARTPLLEVVPVGSQHPGQHVKIHADRSISFRYLSPNMLFLVYETKADMASGLTVVILDTSSGHLLHSQSHSSASGPVAATFYENVAVLHFFDQRLSRWQMTVMELYDTSSPCPTTSQFLFGIVAGNTRKTDQVFAANPTLLKVLRTSTFTQAGVRMLHPIQTRFGVTPKHLLMATFTNQVYNLDTKLIDPDRPSTSRTFPSDPDKRRMPSPQLAIAPQSFATYNMTVSSLRSVRTFPSQLESTVHLMAWGSDVYYSEFRPSHGFDTLGDDFSYVLLLFAIGGMGTAAVVLRNYVQVARVVSRWD